MTIASDRTPAAPGTRYRLSSNLELLCLFDQGDAHGSFGPQHLVIHGWRLRGPLDVDVLRLALGDVVARHEMLRTEVVRHDGEPYLLVHPPSPVEVLVHELPSADPDGRDEQVDDFINEVEAGTLSATALPHLRAEVGRFDDQDAVLVLVTHHTASDGWSLHVIMHDLASAYATRRGHAVAELPPLRQYGEFAEFQIEDLRTADTDARRAHWRDNLAGAEILAIKPDRRFPAGEVAEYAVLRFLVDTELTTSLHNFAKAVRCSPFMVLFAGFNAVLANRTGKTDLVVPIITSGRADPSFHETVGPFFNLMPLRTSIEGVRTFPELVQRIRTTCLEGYANELPFSEVVGVAPQIMAPYALDDTAVCAIEVMQFQSMTEPETIGDIEYDEVRRRWKDCDKTSDIPNGVLVGLDVLPSGEIAGTVRFNTKQFDKPTVAALVEDYRRLLTDVLADPNRPLWAQ